MEGNLFLPGEEDPPEARRSLAFPQHPSKDPMASFPRSRYPSLERDGERVPCEGEW